MANKFIPNKLLQRTITGGNSNQLVNKSLEQNKSQAPLMMRPLVKNQSNINTSEVVKPEPTTKGGLPLKEPTTESGVGVGKFKTSLSPEEQAAARSKPTIPISPTTTPTPVPSPALAPSIDKTQAQVGVLQKDKPKTLAEQLLDVQKQIVAKQAETREGDIALQQGQAEQGRTASERGIGLGLLRGQQAQLAQQRALTRQAEASELTTLTAQEANILNQLSLERDLTKPISIGNKIVQLNPETGEYDVKYSAESVETAEPIVLAAGSSLVSPTGELIYNNPKAETPVSTTDYKNYQLLGGDEEYGSFAEYMKQKKLNESGLPNNIMTQIDKLSSGFESNPLVKNFVEVQNKKNSVDQILAGDYGGPADLALVFEFMKALDPTSVVRESEYEAAAKSGNIFRGWAAQFNGYIDPEGGFLSDAVKNSFQKIINEKFNVSRQEYQNLYDEKARQINMKLEPYGMTNGSDYLVNFDMTLDTPTSQSILPADIVSKIQEVRGQFTDTEILDNIATNPEYTQQIDTARKNNISDTEILEFLISPSSFNQAASSVSPTSMRTDRHNNPTAFTTDIAKQAGLKEGVDYVVGDKFPNSNLTTAKLLGDPVEQTIKVIDNIGFYTNSGKQRWTHTAMTDEQWNSLTKTQKKNVIAYMYQQEGNKGLLNNYFA